MSIIGYSFGAWDLLHVGHIRQLREAKRGCDCLIVGVFTDEALESFKRKPIIPAHERTEMLWALKYVDAVVMQHSIDPTERLRQIQPDILFHGDDWESIPGTKYMESIGYKVVTPPYTKGVSTSGIIKTIEERYCDSCDCGCGVEGRG